MSEAEGSITESQEEMEVLIDDDFRRLEKLFARINSGKLFEVFENAEPADIEGELESIIAQYKKLKFDEYFLTDPEKADWREFNKSFEYEHRRLLGNMAFQITLRRVARILRDEDHEDLPYLVENLPLLMNRGWLTERGMYDLNELITRIDGLSEEEIGKVSYDVLENVAQYLAVIKKNYGCFRDQEIVAIGVAKDYLADFLLDKENRELREIHLGLAGLFVNDVNRYESSFTPFTVEKARKILLRAGDVDMACEFEQRLELENFEVYIDEYGVNVREILEQRARLFGLVNSATAVDKFKDEAESVVSLRTKLNTYWLFTLDSGLLELPEDLQGLDLPKYEEIEDFFRRVLRVKIIALFARTVTKLESDREEFDIVEVNKRYLELADDLRRSLFRVALVREFWENIEEDLEEVSFAELMKRKQNYFKYVEMCEGIKLYKRDGDFEGEKRMKWDFIVVNSRLYELIIRNIDKGFIPDQERVNAAYEFLQDLENVEEKGLELGFFLSPSEAEYFKQAVYYCVDVNAQGNENIRELYAPEYYRKIIDALVA